MQVISVDRTTAVEIGRKPGQARIRNYLGTAGAIDNDPQAFLVELPLPSSTVHPHFHDVDQFQVIIEGDGTIGKKQLQPVTFHYADAFTPYGPIKARENGISFLTLRIVAAGGHFVMPGSKHLMQCRAGRNLVSRFELGITPGPGHRKCETLLEPQPDGVLAVGIRLGPNTQAHGVPSDGGGQYCLVCSGSLVRDGEEYPRSSLALVRPGEPTPIFQAGAQGAEVLVLQYGRPSKRPGSDPANLTRPEHYTAAPGTRM